MTSNSVNGEIFCDLVWGTVIPNLLSIDGLNPTSLVVMDNCSIHHVTEVDDAGIVIYLSP